MKKDKEFLTLVLKGDNLIIEYLKNDKQLKNIKDKNENNIFHYLMAGNQLEMTKKLLELKLISYTLLKKTMSELIKNEGFQKDNYYQFLTFLKEEDKKTIIKKDLGNIIKNNNIKTFNEIGEEFFLDKLENLKIEFIPFTVCNDEMLDTSLPLYKKLKFENQDLKFGFYQLRLNKIRTSILMENLNMYISPLLYEELNNVNDYCGTYLDNRELYNKLDQKLITKEQKQFKKI